MIRTRTVRLAAVAVLGSAVLAGTAGCGSGPMQAGAAVVVDGNRVSDGEVQSRVTQIQDIGSRYAADISKIQQAASANGATAASPNVAQDQVKQIVDEAVWAKAAALVGAKATAADDAAQLQQLVASAGQAFQQTGLPSSGSAEDRISVLAQSFGVNLAPGGVADYVHTSALQNAVIKAVAAKLNVDPSTISQPGPLATAVQQLVAQAAAAVKTKVSPRYGNGASLNPQTLSMDLGSVTPAWVRVAPAPQAAATAPAQPQQQN